MNRSITIKQGNSIVTIPIKRLRNVDKICELNCNSFPIHLHHLLNWTFHSGQIRFLVKWGDYYGVTINGVLAGAICLITNKTYVEIEILTIHPDYQGIGLGKGLVEFAIDWAKRKKVKYLTVGSYSKLKTTRFYKKLGFTKIKSVNDGEWSYVDFEMELI